MSRLEVAINRGAILQFYEAMWGPIYEAVLNILGSTGTILPICDPKHGQPNAATFVTVGEEQLTWTWGEPPASFDTPLDLTDPDSFQGIIPILAFNDTDEEADSPDADYWSRDDSGSNPFSVGAWVNIAGAATGGLFGKWITGASAEWQLFFSSGKPRLQFHDSSTNKHSYATADAALSVNTWHLVILTYDSTGGATAAGGITIYVDGVAVADTDTNNASYVAMENTATLMQLGGAGGYWWGDKLAGGPLGPFFTQIELSVDQVKRIHEIGRRALGL